MIVDHLAQSERYEALGGNIRTALAYLRGTDFTGMEPGEYAVDGDRVYAIVQHYETLPVSRGKWESHRKYLDIQYMVSGSERMGISRAPRMQVIKDYAEPSDLIVYAGEGDFVTVDTGYYAIFYPEDIHMPKVEPVSSPGAPVVKVVMKVRAEP